MSIFEQTLKSISDETTRLLALLDSDSVGDESQTHALKEQIQTQVRCQEFVEHARDRKMGAAEVSRAAAVAAELGRVSDTHPELSEADIDAIEGHSRRIRTELERLEERIE
ncbi:MAG: hypothetical protein ACR2NZ_02735 [Rubripirellula sp.]